MAPRLICPGCRKLDAFGNLDLHSIDPAGDNVLACSSCARRYPIIDGIPLVLANPSAYLRTEYGAVTERDVSPEVAALLVEYGSDDAPYARHLEHIAVYMDAHWGDRADPPDGFACAPFIEKLAALPRVRDAIELGCSAGRICAELARNADNVLGVDMKFSTLRRARHLLAGEDVAYGRRHLGRRYIPAVAHGIASNVRLVCGDALDPPLVPGMYDRVVAFNVFDSVHNPVKLLDVLGGLCAPGGEVILSSPFTWQSDVVDDAHAQFGGTDPVTALSDWFLWKSYTIEDVDQLAWSLRRDSRSMITYQTHFLRVRKSRSVA